jgi:cytochrome c oxidase subunit III
MPDHAHVTPPSHWPMIGCIALVTTVLGGVNWLHGHAFGPYMFFTGLVILFYMMYGWFAEVIHENMAGLNEDKREDRSFRLSMFWFIFTEVMFFAAFFAALFYARIITVPHIGGEAFHGMTHLLLWPEVHATWPFLKVPDPYQYSVAHHAMPAWGLPVLNTLILLSSGLTITIAHWGIVKGHHLRAVVAQILTIILGMLFLYFQAVEYGEAYRHLGLRLDSGIYGTTFYMLTGFHGLHVTVGTLMLMVILYRMLRKDFTAEHHFAFEGVAWYWHFVDVVWLFLFVFVYWL